MRLVRRNSWRLGISLVAVALVAAACGDTASEPPSDDATEQGVIVAPDPAATPISVSVTFTDEGFEPETIFLPAGHPVRLALRNRTEKERHYRVAGLVASDRNHSHAGRQVHLRDRRSWLVDLQDRQRVQ